MGERKMGERNEGVQGAAESQDPCTPAGLTAPMHMLPMREITVTSHTQCPLRDGPMLNPYAAAQNPAPPRVPQPRRWSRASARAAVASDGSGGGGSSSSSSTAAVVSECARSDG